MYKIILKSNFFFTLLGLISILYLSFNEGDGTILFLYFLFLIFGYIVYRGNARVFYFISFGFSLFILPFLLNSYLSLSSKPFIPGGDAERYYDVVLEIINGNEKNYYGRYKLFLFTVSSYYKLILYLGGTNSYLCFFLLNLFMGANIAPLISIIIAKIYDEVLSIKTGVLTVFFPGLIIVATNSWRESFVYTPFLFSIYCCLNIKNLTTLLSYFGAFLFLANIRLEAAITSLIFFISFKYIFVGEEQKQNKSIANNRLFIFIGITSGLLFAYSKGLFEYLKWVDSVSLETQMEAYNIMSNNKIGSENSISNSLRGNGIIGKIFLFIYTLFVPLPPPVFSTVKITFYSVFNSVGAFLWYLILPFSILGLRKGSKDEKIWCFSKAIFVSIFFALLIISLTSVGSARHKYYFYPILFFYFFYFLKNNAKETIVKYFKFIILIYGLLILVYFYIKLI